MGDLLVLCDGPDLIREGSGRKKRRRVFGRCKCGNVTLAEIQARIQSCGCKRGRPTDETQAYEAWIAKAATA